MICQLVEFKTPPYRSHNVELVSKGARSCLRVAKMKEEDFGRIFLFDTSCHDNSLIIVDNS